MAKKKRSRKSSAKKTAGPRSAPRSRKPAADRELLFVGLRALHARLNDLELSIRQLQGTNKLVDDADSVSIGFKKTAGPDHVTVTLVETGEDVLRPFQVEGKSKPFKRGETINANVIVNGGAALNIEVKNASPSALTDRGMRLLRVG